MTGGKKNKYLLNTELEDKVSDTTQMIKEIGPVHNPKKTNQKQRSNAEELF